jgi:hypothetical protein
MSGESTLFGLQSPNINKLYKKADSTDCGWETSYITADNRQQTTDNRQQTTEIDDGEELESGDYGQQAAAAAVERGRRVLLVASLPRGEGKK